MATVASPKLRLKTDNHSLADKCYLRRLLIKEAQLEPLRVLDLYAGSGGIWSELRREPRPDPDVEPEYRIHALNVEYYTPVDSAMLQPGQLRFKITPRLIAALNGDDKVTDYAGTGISRYNVIDVDCYGDPFTVWAELLFRIKQPTAVFLTRGRVTYGAGRMPVSKQAKKVLGIPDSWDIPGRIELLNYADRAQLLQPCPTAKIQFGYETQFPRVTYYALFVSPL